MKDRETHAERQENRERERARQTDRLKGKQTDAKQDEKRKIITDVAPLHPHPPKKNKNRMNNRK